MGRPSLQPGCYFRPLPVGYVEGIDSESEVAWRATMFFRYRQLSRSTLLP